MKKLFYYFLIATLAFNFVGCSDKDKDLDDVIDELDNGSEDDEDSEIIVIDNCTYTIYKNGQAELTFGYDMLAGSIPGTTTPKKLVKGDFVVPETITYDSKTYKVTRVGNGAFTRCNDLTSLTCHDNIESIGIYSTILPLKIVTKDYTGGFKFIVGKGIKLIGGSNLTTMKRVIFIIKATTPPEVWDYENKTYLQSISLYNDYFELYVPSESIDAYKSHTYFKYYDIHSIDELED